MHRIRCPHLLPVECLGAFQICPGEAGGGSAVPGLSLFDGVGNVGDDGSEGWEAGGNDTDADLDARPDGCWNVDVCGLN